MPGPSSSISPASPTASAIRSTLPGQQRLGKGRPAHRGRRSHEEPLGRRQGQRKMLRAECRVGTGHGPAPPAPSAPSRASGRSPGAGRCAGSSRCLRARPAGSRRIRSASRSATGRPSCVADSRSGAVLRTKSPDTSPCRPASTTRIGSSSGETTTQPVQFGQRCPGPAPPAPRRAGQDRRPRGPDTAPPDRPAASGSSSAQIVPAKAASSSALDTRRLRAMPCATRSSQVSASSWSGSGRAGGPALMPAMWLRATCKAAARIDSWAMRTEAVALVTPSR